MIDDVRAAWGAAPPRGALARWSAGAPVGCCVHYIGGAGKLPLADHAACLARMRQLQAAAFSGANGWTYSDVEYNLGVCWHGRIIEARGLGWQGAAQKGANSSWWSVVAFDNVDDVPGPEMIGGLYRAWQLGIATWPAARGLAGHRDLVGNPTGTSCPGNALERWIANPYTAPPPTTKGDDEMKRAIKGDQDSAVWLTDWLQKRWIHDRDEENAIIAAGVTDGAPLVTWPQVWVDRIPIHPDSDLPPTFPKK